MVSQSDNKTAEPSIIHQQLLQWWSVVVEHRGRLLVWVAVGLIIGVVVFVTSPRKYRAEATVITTPSGGPSSSLLSQAQMLTGMSFGQADMAQVFPKIAESRQVLSRIMLEDFQGSPVGKVLAAEFGIDSTKTTLEKEHLVLVEVREAIMVSVKSQENLVAVKVTLGNARLAAELCNHIVNELGLFLETIKAREVQVQNTALETRLVEVAESLQAGEVALLEFRLHNRDRSRSPALLMEEDRLNRKVSLLSSIYQELNRQFEVLQIQKLNESSQFTVLDLAVAPLVPVSPKLVRLVMYFLVLGLVFGLVDLQLLIWGEKRRIKPLVSLLLGRRS